MKYIFILLGIVYPLFTVAFPLSSNNIQTVLNYKDTHGIPIIRITINNNEYSFVFDTGASMTCISDKVVKKEKLSIQASTNYIEGMANNVSFTNITTLKIENLLIENIKAIILPENNLSFQILGIDGIIGANILDKFIVTFNAQFKNIIISKNSPKNMNWEPMKSWDGIPLITIKIQGKEELHDVPAIFDSGSNMGAFGLPSIEGFEQWTEDGLIGNVEEGRGTTTLMLGGRVGTDKLYRGNLNAMVMWKGLTFNLGFYYYWGGKTYNQTLVDRVEVTTSTLTTSNVDRRVYEDRWMQPGDVAFFKGFSNEETRATSRFVMPDNVLELSSMSLQYRWDSDWIKKYTGAQSITFSLNINDLFHWGSIKQERGIDYPFARNIQGGIRFLF